MNKLVISFVLTSLFSFSSFALGDARIDMVCGIAKKTRSAKPLRRLEPALFGVNRKFVLMTNFENPIGYNESHSKNGTYSSNTYTSNDLYKTYTKFSWKDKFVKIKAKFQKAIKSARKKNIDLYACVGRIDTLFKYSGAEAFYSTKSLDDAMRKMRKQAKRHL